MRILREADLISLQDRYIRLLDFDALAELGEFDPGYLHFGESQSVNGTHPFS